jgi:hypothetical protein
VAALEGQAAKERANVSFYKKIGCKTDKLTTQCSVTFRGTTWLDNLHVALVLTASPPRPLSLLYDIWCASFRSPQSEAYILFG